MSIRVRIAPSPTGQDLHIGNLYTALVNWAFARQNKGQFIVRIEDTDQSRLVAGSEKRILQTLKNYGLDYDEGPDKKGPYSPYRQSERLALYQKYAQELVKKGQAYYCTCTPQRLADLRKQQQAKKQLPKYDRFCLSRQAAVKKQMAAAKKFVIRLKIPENQQIEFNDLIRGKISFPSKDIDDQVLLKSDGYPTYHLAVVVDDHLMKISHIIRGEEWISSTPKHILLFKALGWDLPIYCHTPLLRNPDRSKLSKRKNPVWSSWYLDQGYLPQAVLNYLCLMGWAHPQQKDIFTLGEFVKYFKLENISPAGPIFDIKKLDYLNGVYIRQLTDPQLGQALKPFVKESLSSSVIPLLKERMSKLTEAGDLVGFFKKAPVYKKDLFKGDQAKKQLQAITHNLESIQSWTKDEIYQTVKKVFSQENYHKKEFFANLYLAIEGRPQGLPVFESMAILGKTESLKRLTKALELMK